MPPTDWHIAMTLGVLLGAALLAGLLAESLRLPRVTAYLVVGLVLGPQVLTAISENDLVSLDPVGKLAMALVLFSMGCHFTLVHVRRIYRRVLRLSTGEIGLTFFLVSGGLLVLGIVFGISWQEAVLFGSLAVATAPATTILVLKEYESEGPVTEYAMTLVVLNNLVAVILFEMLLLLVHSIGGTLYMPLHLGLGRLAADLAGSVLLGIAGGLIVSFACSLLSPKHWLVLLIAAATLLLGACETWDIPYLLTFLAMGITVANSFERAGETVVELDRITGLLCVVFFVIQGAELNFRQLFEAGQSSLMAICIAYVVLRSAGKYFGVFFSGKIPQEPPEVRRWLGLAILAQAGAALALADIAADPETGLGAIGERIQTVILGTVVVFELFGPILTRQAVLRCGEVPLSHAIHHTSTSPLEALAALGNRLRAALGMDAWHGRAPEDLTVGQLMFRNVPSVSASSSFDEVMELIEHSHNNIYPVIDNDRALVGVIRYANLRDVMFDPELAGLVNAIDVAMPAAPLLYADDALPTAWQQFRHSHDDCIHVVTREEPHRLVGMVKRRDLIRLFAGGGRSADENDS